MMRAADGIQSRIEKAIYIVLGVIVAVFLALMVAASVHNFKKIHAIKQSTDQMRIESINIEGYPYSG